MWLKILVLTTISVLSTAEDRVRYDDFSLFKVYPQNEEHLKYLRGLQDDLSDLQFWKSAIGVGDYSSIVASPEKRGDFEHSLKKRSINYDVMVENLQWAFDNQILGRKRRDTRRQLFWTNYQTRDDIYDWFQHLVDTHSDVVSIIHAGTSFEGRNITGVRISRGSSRGAIFIEGGQVGADWLSPTVVTYLVDQLVRGVDPAARRATEDYEWHIFPIVNPDGHEFSQDADRLWLKNRRPTTSTTVGVDLTKNWNAQWGVRGGSFALNADNYVGLGPFSEPETRAISRYIGSISARLSGVLSFRGFGQRFLIPFAHTTQHLYNYNETIFIARRAMGALSVRYNTLYLVGTSMEVHDGSTGSFADWIKHRFNPPIVGTYQLRDQGTWGYTLPVNQVLPSCEETYDSVMSLIREAQFIDVL